MDIVNTLDEIIPKMRYQMYQKKIPSLDIVNQIVREEGKYYSIADLDIFFAKIGVYLKSQEVTELLNHCKHPKTQIDLCGMVNLIKTEVPQDIICILSMVFDKISGNQQAMDVGELLQHLNESEYPQIELMNKNVNIAKENILRGFHEVIGDNKVINKEQFIDFHKNIYWVIPQYKIKQFKTKLHLMWGIRRLR